MSEPRRGRLLDWKAVLGIAISVAALYWVFKDQDFGLLAAQVKAADPVYFALATISATGVFWIRAWRWKALLDPVRRGTTFRSRFAATAIGFMGNNVFPARVGEFMRPIALSRAENIPLVSSATSLVIERMLDAFTVIAMFFVSLALPGLPTVSGTHQFVDNARIVGLVMLVLLATLIAFVAWPARAVRVAEKVVAKFPARARRLIIDSLEAFLKAAASLRDPRILIRAGGWSIILWLVNALGFWLALRAFGLNYSFNAAVFFQGVLVVGVALPSAPGFFGVYEGMATLVLVGMWGANASSATAFAGAYHIAGYIPITLIGFYYARSLGISTRNAAASEEVVEEAIEAEPSLLSPSSDSRSAT
jgi:uncharacterized protein (TIRG00374 family)